MEPDARDFATDRDYCRHGVYVGNPYGPDYMCQRCELDEPDPESVVVTFRTSLDGPRMKRTFWGEDAFRNAVAWVWQSIENGRIAAYEVGPGEEDEC